MSALRALLRVEARELRRNAGRSWLVILLVAVPVAAMVGGSALLVTARPTAEERRAALVGASDLRVVTRDAAQAATLARELPPEARHARLSSSSARLDGERAVEVLELEPFDLAPRAPGAPGAPASGCIELVAGARPSADGEVALSTALARTLGVDVGDALHLDGASARVAARVRMPEELGRAFVLRPAAPGAVPARSGAVPAGAGAMSAGSGPVPAGSVYVQYAEPALLAARLRELELDVVAREELGEPDPFETLVVFVAGGFGFFECALVIAAAFAVGLRRRQREIGLLAACGADRRSLRVALAGSALGSAGIGGALGLVVGVAGAFALHPFQDAWNGRANGPLEVPLIHAGGALLLGALAALLAAALPAFAATRLSIRVALAGRRPVTEGSRAWLALGLVALALGAGVLVLGTRADGPAAAFAILGGSVLAVLGFGATSPALLGAIARAAGPLPLVWRLALRDAGRFRARNGPVVTAVLAAMSVSVMLAVLAGAVEERAGPANVAAGDAFLGVALGACLVTGLVIVFVATTLSSVESADDARTLHVLGADPRLLRTHAAARAGYLAALGAWLAVPAGLLPGYGLLALANVALEFALPWTTLAAVALGLPVLAFAGAWIFPRFAVGGIPRG